MKAIVCPKYGSPDVLELREVEKPTPGDDDVLIKVHAAALNAADWHIMRADPFLVRMAFGFVKPKHSILGADVAGRVETVGKNVTRFKPGDEVFGDLFESGFGAYAEYACAREDGLVLKPSTVTYEQAAAVPLAGVTALQAVRDSGRIKAGQKVLINGASGGVGIFAVQIAKWFGAHVTAVCSTRNLNIVQELGADRVIDYTQEDFTKRGEHYDLILAVNGYHPIFDYKRALNSSGTYVMIGGSGAQLAQAMLLGPWISMMGGRKMGNMMAKPNQKDLLFLKELMEAGKLKTIIDRSYTLSEVPDAIRHLEGEHARGKIVITV
jgi:NADPH:quinone reductase-like Zn-dependent oxidoreductase